MANNEYKYKGNGNDYPDDPWFAERDREFEAHIRQKYADAPETGDKILKINDEKNELDRQARELTRGYTMHDAAADIVLENNRKERDALTHELRNTGKKG